MIRPAWSIAAWIVCSLFLSGCGEGEPRANTAIAGEYRYDARPFAASIEATLVEDALRRGPSGSTEDELASVRALARGQAEKIATSISATLELRENGAAVFVSGDMRDAFVKGKRLLDMRVAPRLRWSGSWRHATGGVEVALSGVTAGDPEALTLFLERRGRDFDWVGGPLVGFPFDGAAAFVRAR